MMLSQLLKEAAADRGDKPSEMRLLHKTVILRWVEMALRLEDQVAKLQQRTKPKS